MKIKINGKIYKIKITSVAITNDKTFVTSTVENAKLFSEVLEVTNAIGDVSAATTASYISVAKRIPKQCISCKYMSVCKALTFDYDRKATVMEKLVITNWNKTNNLCKKKTLTYEEGVDVVED